MVTPTHRNLVPLLKTALLFLSSTRPVGSLPSSFHCFNASLPAAKPTARTSENRLNPPNVSNCCSSARRFKYAVQTNLDRHGQVQTVRIGLDVFQCFSA